MIAEPRAEEALLIDMAELARLTSLSVRHAAADGRIARHPRPRRRRAGASCSRPRSSANGCAPDCPAATSGPRCRSATASADRGGRHDGQVPVGAGLRSDPLPGLRAAGLVPRHGRRHRRRAACASRRAASGRRRTATARRSTCTAWPTGRGPTRTYRRGPARRRSGPTPTPCTRSTRPCSARLTLSKAHREALRRRGLADDAIDRAGYRTLPGQGRPADRPRTARALRRRAAARARLRGQGGPVGALPDAARAGRAARPLPRPGRPHRRPEGAARRGGRGRPALRLRLVGRPRRPRPRLARPLSRRGRPRRPSWCA